MVFTKVVVILDSKLLAFQKAVTFKIFRSIEKHIPFCAYSDFTMYTNSILVEVVRNINFILK